MRFTEHEMTVAVDAAGRALHAGARPPWRRGGVAGAHAAYDSLTRAQAYPLRAAAGEIVLPALTALPERPTVGAPPDFSEEEYAAAAAEGGRTLLEHRRPGAWDAMSERRRRKVVAAAAGLTRAAVAAMPVRQDPDALIVPDYLE